MALSRRIFAFWTGDNTLSPNRQRCLGSLVSCCNVRVEFVNSVNLSSWLVSPLHPAYEFLSLTHRSDYLRAYFMHHHGGGYTDIKMCTFDWIQFFDLLECSDTALMMGYAERRRCDVGSFDKNVCDLYRTLPGMGAFIFKPYSPLTYSWFARLNQLLDRILPALQRTPGSYHPRAISGGVHSPSLLDIISFSGSCYPLEWNTILGGILHPLLASPQFLRTSLLDMPYVDLSPYK